MHRRHLAWMLLVAVALAAPALAGEKCGSDTQTCLNKMASNMKARGWVGLEVENEHGKLMVTSVEPDGPAMRAGIVAGDVLLAMDGVEINEANHEKLYAAKKHHTVGATTTYTVSRGGCCHKKATASDVAVERAAVPDAVLARWVGGHMVDHAVIASAARY
jgi:predicted metalloprotease with PDZ domain